MCPDVKIESEISTEWAPAAQPELTFTEPRDNPLYDYLIDLQRKRVHLVNTLSPNRHIKMQLILGGGLIGLWLLDRLFPSLGGLPIALIILLGPFILFAAPYIAGRNVQLLAVQNYPSPLDSPNALELLLTTPLSGKEIVFATLAAYLRYPFIGSSILQFVMVLLNLLLLSWTFMSSFFRGTLALDILVLSLNFYLPAFSVYLFYPVLTAIDQLFIPSNWIHNADGKSKSNWESIIGRGGRLPILAMILALVPTLIRVNNLGPVEVSTVSWVFKRACPLIIFYLAIATILLALMLPKHLESLRRR
jgi:hypothetical protein